MASVHERRIPLHASGAPTVPPHSSKLPAPAARRRARAPRPTSSCLHAVHASNAPASRSTHASTSTQGAIDQSQLAAAARHDESGHACAHACRGSVSDSSSGAWNAPCMQWQTREPPPSHHHSHTSDATSSEEGTGSGSSGRVATPPEDVRSPAVATQAELSSAPLSSSMSQTYLTADGQVALLPTDSHESTAARPMLTGPQSAENGRPASGSNSNDFSVQWGGSRICTSSTPTSTATLLPTDLSCRSKVAGLDGARSVATGIQPSRPPGHGTSASLRQVSPEAEDFPGASLNLIQLDGNTTVSSGPMSPRNTLTSSCAAPTAHDPYAGPVCPTGTRNKNNADARSASRLRSVHTDTGVASGGLVAFPERRKRYEDSRAISLPAAREAAKPSTGVGGAATRPPAREAPVLSGLCGPRAAWAPSSPGSASSHSGTTFTGTHDSMQLVSAVDARGAARLCNTRSAGVVEGHMGGTRVTAALMELQRATAIGLFTDAVVMPVHAFLPQIRVRRLSLEPVLCISKQCSAIVICCSVWLVIESEVKKACGYTPSSVRSKLLCDVMQTKCEQVPLDTSSSRSFPTWPRPASATKTALPGANDDAPPTPGAPWRADPGPSQQFFMHVNPLSQAATPGSSVHTGQWGFLPGRAPSSVGTFPCGHDTPRTPTHDIGRTLPISEGSCMFDFYLSREASAAAGARTDRDGLSQTSRGTNTITCATSAVPDESERVLEPQRGACSRTGSSQVFSNPFFDPETMARPTTISFRLPGRHAQSADVVATRGPAGPLSTTVDHACTARPKSRIRRGNEKTCPQVQHSDSCGSNTHSLRESAASSKRSYENLSSSVKMRRDGYVHRLLLMTSCAAKVPASCSPIARPRQVSSQGSACSVQYAPTQPPHAAPPVETARACHTAWAAPNAMLWFKQWMGDLRSRMHGSHASGYSCEREEGVHTLPRREGTEAGATASPPNAPFPCMWRPRSMAKLLVCGEEVEGEKSADKRQQVHARHALRTQIHCFSACSATLSDQGERKKEDEAKGRLSYTEGSAQLLHDVSSARKYMHVMEGAAAPASMLSSRGASTAQRSFLHTNPVPCKSKSSVYSSQDLEGSVGSLWRHIVAAAVGGKLPQTGNGCSASLAHEDSIEGCGG